LAVRPILPYVTRSPRSIIVTLLAAVTLAGCATASPVAAPSAPAPDDSTPTHSPAPAHSSTPTHASAPTHSAPTHSHSTRTHSSAAPSTPAGPRIVSFRIAQRPKCAEGTAVFRAPAVPLIIEWKITGATRGALSVDDPTHTPGTYGPVTLQGSQDFTFSCAGDVGATETHTYALYTVGGGPMRSATLTVSAKILDKGR
jgi:hypothetical protein